MQSPSLARRVVSTIDCFLNVTTSFLQNLPHLTSTIRGKSVLVANQYLTKAEQYLGPSGGGSGPPTIASLLCGVDRQIHNLAGSKGKCAYEIASVGRVDFFKHFTRFARH